MSRRPSMKKCIKVWYLVTDNRIREKCDEVWNLCEGSVKKKEKLKNTRGNPVIKITDTSMKQLREFVK